MTNGNALVDLCFRAGEFSVRHPSDSIANPVGGETIRSLPAEPIPFRLRVAQIALLIYACIWGIDYLNSPPYDSLYPAEKLIGPLALWGGLFLFFGLMGMVGELWIEVSRNQVESARFLCCSDSRWWPSFAAHTGLCTMYSMLTFACGFELMLHTHLYGMRMVGGMIALAVGHWVFVQRRGHAT